MAEFERTKNGGLLICDCGLVHKLSLNEETDEVIVETKFKKKEGANGKKKVEPKRKSIFGS